MKEIQRVQQKDYPTVYVKVSMMAEAKDAMKEILRV